MKAFIQYVKQVAAESNTPVVCQCNYGDDYYGDQVCTLTAVTGSQWQGVLADYARSHG